MDMKDKAQLYTYKMFKKASLKRKINFLLLLFMAIVKVEDLKN